MKVAQYEVLGLKQKGCPSRQRRSKHLAFGLAHGSAIVSILSIVPSGTNSSLKTLTQHFVLGYFRRVAAGLIFTERLTTCAILIATPEVDAHDQICAKFPGSRAKSARVED